MMDSNNSDTSRYTYPNIFSSFSQNGCANTIIQNKNEVKTVFTLYKILKTFIKHLYTNLIAETFINL